MTRLFSQLARIRWKRWAVSLAALVVIVAVSFVTLIQTDWFKQKLLERIVSQVESATGGYVTLTDYDFRPFELSATVRDLAVRSSPPDTSPAFLHIPVLHVQLGVTSFLRRQVYLRSLRLESPQVRIEIAEDGTSNLPQFSEREELALADELFDLAVDRLDLAGGSLSWNGARYPLSFVAEPLFLRTRYERNLGRYRAWVRLGESSLGLASRQPLVTESEMEFFLYRDRIEAPDIYLAGTGFQLFGRLQASPLSAPVVTAEYKATVQLAALSELRGAGVESGEAQADGTVRWQSSNSGFEYEGRIEARGLSLASAPLEGSPVTMAARYVGNQDSLTLTDLRADALGGVFTGEVALDRLSPPATPRFQIRGDFDGFPLEALSSALAPMHPSLLKSPFTSSLRGWLQAAGTGIADLDASVSLLFAERGVSPPGRVPLRGVADVSYKAATGIVQVPRLELQAAGARLQASGTITRGGSSALQVLAETDRPADLLAVLDQLGVRSEGWPTMRGGMRFEGELRGGLLASSLGLRFRADVEANDFDVQGHRWKQFRGEVDFTPSRIEIRQGRIEDESGSAEIAGSVALRQGKPDPDGAVEGEIRFTDLAIADVLRVAVPGMPVQGTASGSVQVTGTLAAPAGAGQVTISNGSAWQQPFDHLQATLRFDRQRQSLESLEIRYGQARLQAQADITTPDQQLRFDLEATQWRLHDLQMLSGQTDLEGDLAFNLSGSAQLSGREDPFEALSASGGLKLTGLQLQGKDIGYFTGKISTQPAGIRIDWNGDLTAGSLEGSTEWRTAQNNSLAGSLAWKNVDVAVLAALADLPLERTSGVFDGNFTFSGELTEPETWRAGGEVTRLEVAYAEIPGANQGYSLWNPFPMRWSVANRTLRLESMRLLGEGTDVLVNGQIGLAEPRLLDLSTDGTFNLAVLEGFDPGLEARGASTLQIAVQGSVAKPRIQGRMEVQDASLRHSDFANGLSQMNGVLRFNDRQVNIESLTASSGGGTLRVNGMAERLEEEWSYRLDVDVDRIRFRYPEQVRSVIVGNVTLSGTSGQSLLSGDMLVSRLTLSANLELGAVLARLAEPRQTMPSSPALSNMRLNVRIDSVPDLRVETALVRNATADFDLRLTGTALNPALLGDVNLTQGQLEFQGTRFDINRGAISFVNPFRIDPVIDFELETRVRDIDIALTLSGPARKINVTPRSDPPLPFSDLITLLALGRTPTTDPVLAARQTIAQQSLTQTGANNVLSQALSQPVNRRLQRFFGVSRLKVDPQAGGAEANPSARISTEQQVTNELTFTYSYDLSSAQQQVVRVDWTPTRQWSFIVTRDENGLVGADVLFKKRFP